LFNLLLQKGVSAIVVRLLLQMYTNQQIHVSWNGKKSPPFGACNGVKQGGVLSPVLFGLYIDELLTRLSVAGFGCHIGNTFMAAFAYADDLILLAPTKESMNKMLSITSDFSEEYCLLFNATKSKHLIYGDVLSDANNITFMGKIIKQVPNDKHLGNLIGSNTDKQKIVNCSNDFVRRVNETMSLFKKVNCNIKYKLIKSFCMPLYGCQLWDIASKHFNIFNVTWRKCIRKSFNLPYTTHCNLLHLICNDFKLETQIHMRISKFLYSCINSDNYCVKLCTTLALGGSDSSFCSSIDFICEKYKITKDFIRSNSHKKLICIMKAHDELDNDSITTRTATQIKELLYVRDNHNYNDNGLTKDEISSIIEFLCTHFYNNSVLKNYMFNNNII
jgi:hypothetical protein